MQNAQPSNSIPPITVIAPCPIGEESDGGRDLRAGVGRASTAPRPTGEEHERAPLDIFEPFRILRRRRLCLLISIPVFLLLAVLSSVLMPAKYTATSKLQLVTEQTGRLSFGDSASANAEIFDSFATL